MHPKPPAQAAQPLCDGPRGRRFLIEYALESEARRRPRHGDRDLYGAVFAAAHHLGEGFGSPGIPAVPPARVARLVTALAETQLLPPEPTTILRCLQAASEEAAYWQPPSGMDNLTATAPVRAALRRVARHLSACGMDPLWSSPLEPTNQWALGWGDHPLPAPLREDRAALRERRAELRAASRHGGMWWSIPSPAIPSSTPPVCGPAPLGLWCVEDSLGWTRAQAARLVAPEGLRVYEVGSAADWAHLCARFPLDVTRAAGRSWRLATGRRGRWVLPDWVRVAREYDAVHLQPGAYLAAAGTAIEVGGGAASVIGGWDPHVTYWFHPRVCYFRAAERWEWAERAGEGGWVRAPHHPQYRRWHAGQ
ncbi:hypothetical protein [Corynebacterium mastitidis]|uniref:hypothetical protein n=1 Tax=Corynebacterium mastitidis TaxID=161890 RepID=UPI0003607519|nr:hypothetical protein [Corynebacterium mastitidis]